MSRLTGFSFLLTLLFFVGCVAAPSPVPPGPAAPGVVSAHGRLHTAGNRIVGADGQPVSLAGVSYGWSQWEAARFYNADVVDWLKQDWHAAIIRAPLGVHEEDGYLQHPARNRARVMRVVDAAITSDVYVLIDWHDHQAQLHAEQAVALAPQHWQIQFNAATVYGLAVGIARLELHDEELAKRYSQRALELIHAAQAQGMPEKCVQEERAFVFLRDQPGFSEFLK